jgi:class 3 adenylate cyclase
LGNSGETSGHGSGLHSGTPIVYRDDVSGRTDLTGTDVDKAARVESIARGGQVLISEQTRVLTDCMAVHDWEFWELQFFPSDIAPAR